MEVEEDNGGLYVDLGSDLIGQGIRRIKSREDEEEDRISSLPDSLIHHILSFLPLTKDAVKQDYSKYIDEEFEYCSSISELVTTTLMLHSSSKLKKFHLELMHGYSGRFIEDSETDLWLCFAVDREVEILTLNFFQEFQSIHDDGPVDCRYKLPQFLYNYCSLRELDMECCASVPKRCVSWPLLKILNVRYAKLNHYAIECILKGSPLLEDMRFYYCEGIIRLDLSLNRHLKKLVIDEILDCTHGEYDSVFELSAPYLQELVIPEKRSVVHGDVLLAPIHE